MYYIVRHGETEKNKEKTLQGRSDLGLNENGERQADALGVYFRERGITFDAVYASPLKRAVQTAARIAGEDKKIRTDDRLIEMDYGPYEGVSLVNPPEEIITFFSDFVHNEAPEGMESLSAVTARMGDFLMSIHGNPAENILISTHAIAMKGALEFLTPEAKGAYWSKYLPNCGVYCFEENDKGFGCPTEIKNKFGE